MEKGKLIELIKKIQRSEGNEEDADNDIELLCNSVNDPQAVSYIFYDDNLSAEDIAEKILSYKTINL
ncbi:TPA: hypothetical protein I8608_002110 [Morganella morganii]|uniref:Uncharacterized protein n=1 Tax=Morganella morganii TaxID=582 RepID=A0AAN5MHF3_MORMO|nr:hypothetical protein [Morganella morganii]